MITIKRFWLFEWPDYYQKGGMMDHRGCFDSVKETLAAIQNTDFTFNNSEIWDIQEMKPIWRNGKELV